MNEKGRQTKLLAAVAILAMVVCVFAVAMPSDNVDAAATPSDADNATINTETGWSPEAGVYKLTANWNLTYADEIPAGVTLYTNGFEISTIGGELTVNGTLYLNEGSEADSKGTLNLEDRSDLKGTGTIYLCDASVVSVGEKTLLGSEAVEFREGSTATVTEFNGTSGFNLILTAGTATVKSGYTTVGAVTNLTVGQNTSVTIVEDVTINGTVVNNGTVTISQETTVTNNGSFTNNGTVNYGGEEYGTITNGANGTLIDTTMSNPASITDVKDVEVLGSETTTGTIGGAGWTYDFDEDALTLTGATIENIYFTDVKSVSVEGQNTITVSPTDSLIAGGFGAIKATVASAMTISGEGSLGIIVNMGNTMTIDSGDRIAAIYATGNLTVTADRLYIDVNGTVNEPTGNIPEAVYGIYMSDADANLGIGDADDAVELDITVAESDGLAFAIAYGVQTYTNVTGDITAGNRGIQIGGYALTFNDAELTITGGEKAIQAKTTEGSVSLTNGSEITLELADANLNNGMNDRWGLKAVKLTIDATSTLTTDGLRITSNTANSEISGTLHVTYNAGAGLIDGETVIFPAGLALWADAKDDGKDVPTENALRIVIKNGGEIIVDANNAIAGMIVADDDSDGNDDSSATFGALVAENGEIPAHLNYITVTSTATFSYGSLDVDGGFAGETPIVLGGNGEYDISGTYDTPIDVEDGTSDDSTTKLNIPSGRSAEFNKRVGLGNYTDFNAIGDISGEGEIAPGENADPDNINVTSSNPGAMGDMLGGGLTAEKNETTTTTNGTTGQKFTDLVGNNSVIILTDDYEVSGTENLPSTVTVYLNGYNIIIGADDVLNVNGATIREGLPANLNGATVNNNGTKGWIDVQADGTFSLDGADVFAPVDADMDAYVVLQNTKSVTISDGQITGPIEVGYGNTINANSITVPSSMEINVYGTLNVNGTIRVNNGGEFNVHQGGEAVIAGTLNIAGTANIDGKMTVEGAVSMQGSGNSTSFTVGSTGTVDVATGATFTVNRANGSYSNTLTVSGEFNVEGTLVINGTLSGNINDFGTVQINGTIANAGAYVYIYDGVSVNVTSVSGGVLTISDAKAIENYTDGINSDSVRGQSGNNFVTLRPGAAGNIGGITVSTAVASYISNGVGYYFADMTVAGTVTSSVNGGTVDITGTTGTGYRYNADGDVRTGQVYIGDMALGAGVVLDISNGDVYVQGAVDATAAGNTTTGVSSPVVTISGGDVTVEGSIEIINNDIDNTQYLNAAHYTTLEGVNTYYHYTSADAAIAAIDGADQKTVTFYGEVSVTSDASISSRENVIVSSGSTLNIEAVLTIEDGAYFTNSGTVEVKDTMIVTNYLATYNGTQPGADVMSTNGNDRTYMSLASALESGATAITLNRNVEIDGNVTVPEGVTVSGNGVDITVNPRATLTVDGAVELVRGDIKLVDGTTSDGAMIVNGHITVYTYEPASETVNGTQLTYLDLQDVVDGAFFSKRVNGLATNFVSSIGYAATAVDDSVTQITIYGNVTTTDVTFTAGKQGLVIAVIDIDQDNQSSLTVGTMTLVGATLNLVGTNNGDITGTVAVQDGDGNVVGSINADEANGFAFSAYQQIAADGADNYAYIIGNIEGGLEIVAGTVTVGPNDEGTSLTVNDDSTFTVASGATLVLDDDMTVSAAAGDAKDAILTVDGTITVNDSLTINGDAVVNGTMDVTSDSEGSGIVTVADTGDLRIIGTLNVEAYSTSNYGKVVVGGVMTVGSAPESLGVGGAVTGNIGIVAGGYVKAYAGADLSAAVFVSSNGTAYTVSTVAESTQYLINGVEYMTVYAISGVTIYEVIDAEEFELSGIFNGVNFGDASKNTGLYDIDNWYTNESMAANTVLDDEEIGEVSAVYGKAQAATVYGTVSEGDGLTLYIDNVPIANSSAQYPLTVGTHTVAFTVQSGYDGSDAVIEFNGQTVTSGGTIEITAGMETFTLTVTGATPASQTVTVEGGNGGSEMGLTDYLLIILVILIVIMAIMVAFRLMRS